MAQGKVTINNLNLAQGDFPEIEGKTLYIGEGATGVGSVLSINTQTDLDVVLGAADSEIRRNVEAARLNGGENWLCYAAPQANGYTVNDVIDQAMLTVSPELIAVCTPVTTSAEFDALQAKAESLRTSLARRVIMLVATEGINPATETWADYEIAQAAITNGVAAYRCAAIPLLHGNDLGVVAGRLCNRSVSVSDSPMRVATGALIGLGTTPVDSNGVELPSATLTTLDANRLSCVQSYPDYPGIYFGDVNLLDVPAGDYQVIEYLRPMDKLARRIRVLQIQMVANRSFNSTPVSMAATKTYLMRPAREMSHSQVVAGRHFPGDIKPPKEDAITLVWEDNSTLKTYIKAQPYKSPKDIETNMILDLSGT